jgi:hypothetical protein
VPEISEEIRTQACLNPWKSWLIQQAETLMQPVALLKDLGPMILCGFSAITAFQRGEKLGKILSIAGFAFSFIPG